jgi:TonB family protein
MGHRDLMGQAGANRSERALRAAIALAAVSALAAGLAAPRRASAQQGVARATAQQFGAIDGVVRDSAGNGIAGAQVWAGDGGQRALTDDDGRFLLRSIPLGDVRLTVRRLGFAPYEVLTTITRPGVARTITITLTQLPQRIAGVEVQGKRQNYTGPMADFYHRLDSKARGGHFFTREQIDSIRPQRTTDLLRRVPGLHFVPYGQTENVIRSRDSRCSPLIWIDGTPAAIAYYDPDLINPRTIEGIEVYPGTATVPNALQGPAGTSSCGAIAIWTRAGDPGERRPDKAERAQAAATLAALVDSIHVYTEAEVDRAAQLAPSSHFAPVYPAELKRNNVTGVVVAEFVVDTQGRIERETVGMVYSPDPLFSAAVSVALDDARFTPAMRQGHPVRQYVQLPVHFVNPQQGR